MRSDARVRSVGHSSLDTFLSHNPILLPEYLNRCYTAEPQIARRFYTVMCPSCIVRRECVPTCGVRVGSRWRTAP